MRFPIFILLVCLLPFFAFSQSFSGWRFYLNKTKLLSASSDSAASVQLPKEKKGSIKICFAKRDTAFNRTLLIMNEERQTLLQKEMKTSGRTASFLMADLLSKSGGKPVVIYLADIPADPAKAMLVRVAPAAICDITWK